MLFADRHHQRAGVVLDKDAGNAVTARCMVYHPLLGNRPYGSKYYLRFLFKPLCPSLILLLGIELYYFSLTRSVTENWCVSADILYVFSLVGTTVMKYWNIWLSEKLLYFRFLHSFQKGQICKIQLKKLTMKRNQLHHSATCNRNLFPIIPT